MPVQPGVLQGLPGLIRGLSQVGQQGSGNSLVDVGRCLPGGDVEGQLVHDTLQCICGRHRCEGGVVGRSDATVHRCGGGMVGQLKVHGGRRALAVDFDLESVQGRLVGLGGQALGQAGVHGHEAGGVGQDGALGGCEVCSQSVRGQVRSCGQGGHLALQCCDGCGVDSDGGGVLGRCLQGGVLGQGEGELPGGDALQLNDRGRRLTIIEDSARECGTEQ